MEFKIGDVVTLKSGGPDMTVEGKKNDYGTESTTELMCTWFDNKGIRNTESFHKDTLEISEDDN